MKHKPWPEHGDKDLKRWSGKPPTPEERHRKMQSLIVRNLGVKIDSVALVRPCGDEALRE